MQFCDRNWHAPGIAYFLLKNKQTKSLLWAFLRRKFPWLAPRRKCALSVCIRGPPSQLGAAGALKAPGPARSRSAVVRTAGTHSQHSNGNSHMALGDRRSARITAGSALGCAIGKGTPGWVWRCDAVIFGQRDRSLAERHVWHHGSMCGSSEWHNDRGEYLALGLAVAKRLEWGGCEGGGKVTRHITHYDGVSPKPRKPSKTTTGGG